MVNLNLSVYCDCRPHHIYSSAILYSEMHLYTSSQLTTSIKYNLYRILIVLHSIAIDNNNIVSALPSNHHVPTPQTASSAQIRLESTGLAVTEPCIGNFH